MWKIYFCCLPDSKYCIAQILVEFKVILLETKICQLTGWSKFVSYWILSEQEG